MRPRVAARVLTALAPLLGVRGASAAAPRFELEEQGCAALDGNALRELVELELRTLSLSDTGARLVVACTGETATVSLTDAEGRPFPVESRVDFSKAEPGARERLVALSATELVAQAERAGDGTRRRAAAAEPVPAPRAVDRGGERGAESTGKPRASTQLSLAGVGTVTGHPATVLGGVSLGAGVAIAGPWVVVFDARFERGTTDTDPARVGWTMLGASAAVMLEATAAPVRVDVGAGGRAARVVLHAEARAPDRGGEVEGAWVGPMLCARAAFDLAPHAALVTLGEGGYATLPVRGTVDGDEVIVTAGGPWVSLGLGIAAVF